MFWSGKPPQTFFTLLLRSQEILDTGRNVGHPEVSDLHIRKHVMGLVFEDSLLGARAGISGMFPLL
jgi:hypothetical protein